MGKKKNYKIWDFSELREPILMIFGALISYARALSPRNKKKTVSRKNDHPFPEKPVFSEQCEGSEVVGCGWNEHQKPMKNGCMTFLHMQWLTITKNYSQNSYDLLGVPNAIGLPGKLNVLQTNLLTQDLRLRSFKTVPVGGSKSTNGDQILDLSFTQINVPNWNPLQQRAQTVQKQVLQRFSDALLSVSGLPTCHYYRKPQ